VAGTRARGPPTSNAEGRTHWAVPARRPNGYDLLKPAGMAGLKAKLYPALYPDAQIQALCPLDQEAFPALLASEMNRDESQPMTEEFDPHTFVAEEKRRGRQAVRDFVDGISTGNVELITTRVLQELDCNIWPGTGWAYAFRKVAQLQSVPDAAREYFLWLYVRYGDHIRQEVGHDLTLLDGLRALLAPTTVPQCACGAVREREIGSGGPVACLGRPRARSRTVLRRVIGDGPRGAASSWKLSRRRRR